MSAAYTFNLQQVSDGVHGSVQVGANCRDIRRCWSEDQWRILPRRASADSKDTAMREICAVFFIFQQCKAPAAAHRA